MYVSLFKNLSNGVSKGRYGEDSLVIKNGDQSLKVKVKVKVKVKLPETFFSASQDRRAMSEVMRPHKATQSRCQGLVLCFFILILWSYDPRPWCIYLTVVWSINHTDSFWSTKSKARLALLDCWLLRSQSQMKERSTECYTNWTDCPGNAYDLKRGFILLT